MNQTILSKIEPFATANDTDRWVVSVDGYIQSFDTRAKAESVYASITPEGQHFDDTAFGCCQIIPPHYRPINKLAEVLHEPEDMTRCTVSEVRQIDLIGYILKHPIRARANFTLKQIRDCHTETTRERLGRKRAWDSLWKGA